MRLSSLCIHILPPRCRSSARRRKMCPSRSPLLRTQAFCIQLASGGGLDHAVAHRKGLWRLDARMGLRLQPPESSEGSGFRSFASRCSCLVSTKSYPLPRSRCVDRMGWDSFGAGTWMCPSTSFRAFIIHIIYIRIGINVFWDIWSVLSCKLHISEDHFVVGPFRVGRLAR